jgi:mono/diheme cytochrome c family protein
MKLLSSQTILAIALGLQGGLPAFIRAGEPVSFDRDIRPVLSNNCFGCHGPDAKQRKAELRLDTGEGVLSDRGGHAVIVPGKPEASELIRRISGLEPGKPMPPKKTGKKLTPREIDLFTRWVQQGGRFNKHWSYARPVRPALPAVKLKTWPRNPIDHFILARLERERLRPSPEADRYALIRRVSLDLTGLPPSVAEVDTFVEDKDPAAYEKLVGRLLEKSAYGEHWARLWLDLARYADSAGYADDPPRTIWLFRDYVIKALNANKPFDQFTVEQIAGDLLPNPTQEQLIASAFHRNTMTNNEGGTDKEEFRNVAVVDRVNTTMAVWMGTTINCAQCHDHKYDPISQEEYFRFFAILNNTEDADRSDEAPVLSTESKEEKRRRTALQVESARLEVRLLAASSLSAVPQLQGTQQRLVAIAKQLAELKPLTVPIMRELPEGKRRKTKIQHRGNFLDVGKEVSEGVPAAFPPFPNGSAPNRLALARWLVADSNPLTARVIVNRYWEQVFGIGIVGTSEDFGAQGDLPEHPELLDWLATELVRLKWDTKALLKLLVTSAAYRQSSRVIPELEQRDPENRLLARGPRFRLSAEMVRDQALFASGLLSPKMYGPPVKPPQPTGGLTAAFGSGIDWQTSSGGDRYRRALYTMWRRSSPYPSMATFDAPNREFCLLRRTRTNTPLQALVTLNDPVYVEAAQALARKVAADQAATPAERAGRAFRICLSRPPHPEELERMVRLYEQTRNHMQAHANQARDLASNPLGPLPKSASPADLAAWTVVGNVLLNLDEMLMKR